MQIQSVDRAMRILLEFRGSRTLGLSELATRVDLANSTAHGLLNTLAARGMVERNSAGRYTLGPAVLGLGNVYLDSNELRLRSLSAAKALSDRTSLAVRVAVLLGNDIVVVHHVLRPDGSRQMSEIGVTIPATASALGKAMLAFLPDARGRFAADAPLAQLTGRTIATHDELDVVLTTVRAEGVARGVDEVVIGEAEVASPIFDARSIAVGAIGVVVPSLEYTADATMANAVRDAAITVSRSMGAPAWRIGG
jgi:DNA-binding IclR family transcriptional regulator